MSKPNLYTVGGAVQAGGGLYIHRQADNDLLKLCREGAFAYVLTSRQVGKSSLVVRAAEQLREEGIRAVIVDLTEFGVQVTAEAWYLGLLTAIGDRLGLSTDVIEWWRGRGQFGFTQRLTQFFHEVLLAEIKERTVIFIDEIDSTLSLPANEGAPFTDDFYAAIRYLYNARATMPDFKRLSFVLIGVATPGDLIRDPRRTPFNIGQRVDITDFTYDEALPLAEGLEMPPEQARQVLRWVIKWTGGHPYLTQRLCRAIADQHRTGAWTEAEVDRTVANTFFGKMSEHDNNLQFVRDMLTKRAPESALAVLSAYKEIRLGRQAVRDEEQSPIKSHLKLSGVVKREDGKLAVRNPIYREVFDKRWIQEHWPVGWWETIPKAVKIAAGFVVFLFVTLIVLLTMYVGKLKEVAAGQKQITREKDRRIFLTDSLYNVATQALAEAQTQRQKADSAKSRSDSLAIEKDKSSAYAKEQQKLAEQQAELAKKNEDDAKKSTAEAIAANEKLQKSLSVEERRRRIDIARTLALQAPQELQLGNEDVAALLARQAFLLNQRHGGSFESEIYQSLLKSLNGKGGPMLLRGHKFAVKTVAIHPDSPWVASGSEDGAIRLWNLQQTNTSLMVLRGHTATVRAVAFSPNGKFIASGSDDRTVRLWELVGSSYKSDLLNAHTDGVWAVAFSPDGNWLASGGADKTVRLWDLRQNPPASKLLPKQDDRVRCVVFSPNGQTLAAASDDGNIRLWDLRQPEHDPKVLGGHKGRVNAVAFSPDGQTLASAGNDFTVRLWNWRASNDSVRILRSHEAVVNTVAFSRDGQTLASGSHDRNVFLWHWRRQKDSPSLALKNDSQVWSVTFSRDGKRLVAGCEDKIVRLWFTQAELLADIVCAKVKRNLSAEEWEKYVSNIPYEKTCPHLPAGKSGNAGTSSSTNR